MVENKVPWLRVGIFVLISTSVAWLVALPLWLKVVPNFLFGVFAGVMMLTPAVAALLVTPGGFKTKVAEMKLWPIRDWKQTLGVSVAMLFIPALLVALGLGFAALVDWVSLDVHNFSGFEESLRLELGGSVFVDMPPIHVLALLQIACIPLNAAASLLLPVFLGEEIGWRGWLLPSLLPLGLWPALLFSGAIWGLWHAPLALLGHNFDRTDIWGLVLTVIGCSVWGVLFGWLRLRFRSLWPVVFAHAGFNASSSLLVVLPAAGQEPNLELVNPLGVSGWIIAACVIGVLVAAGQFAPEKLEECTCRA